jgi:hypothetical protein
LIAIAADRATSKRYRSAQGALEMAESFTAAQMYELGTRHASIEARGDIDGTMATLVEDPVYELLPIGLAMRGREQVLRYYENLIGKFIPMTVGYELLEEWVNETSVCQEYRIEVKVGVGVNGVREAHRVVGVLCREGSLLGGERVYASERCLRLMAGDDLIDELEPLSKSARGKSL